MKKTGQIYKMHLPKISIYTICLVIFLMFPFDSIAGISRIWAIDDGEKIKQDDISNSLAENRSNPVWDGSTVRLFCAKNEVVAFQLIIQADNAGAEDVDAVVSDLKNKTHVLAGSKGGSSDEFDYRGRNVELFTEHYINVTKRTSPTWFWHESAAPSDYYSGWLPDCLIPFSAPIGKGGAPFSIASNKNQAVWVDIFIPKEALEGKYFSDIDIIIDGNSFKIIPLELTVYGFTLPDESHIKNSFTIGIQDLATRHNETEGSVSFRDLETRYHQMAHRHRFNLGQNVSSIGQMDSYHKLYLDGSMFSNEAGYEGPGANIGNNTFMMFQWVSEYGGTPAAFNESLWWSGSDAWMEWFSQNAPNTELCRRIDPDEPFFAADTHTAYSSARQQCAWNKTNPGSGSNMFVQSSCHIIQNLVGSVTYWLVSGECTSSRFSNLLDVETERSFGHKWGFYNGFRPCMGAVTIDADAVEFRVIPWIMYKYDVDQYAYWRVNYWENIDVFSDPITYASASANGDGTFFYPGRDFLFPDQDRGLNGPMSSIRMKNWRRGAQDYEYLWLAKQNGIQVDDIVNKCIPNALWDAELGKDVSWPQNGWGFENCRREIMELLSASGTNNKDDVIMPVTDALSYINIKELNGRLQVGFKGTKSGDYTVKINNLAGRVILDNSFYLKNLGSGNNLKFYMQDDIPSGVYLISVKGAGLNLSARFNIIR